MIRCTSGFVRILDDDNKLSDTIGKQVLNLLEEDFDERITYIQCRIRIQKNLKTLKKERHTAESMCVF
jgi:hypothetical protein